MKILIQTLSSSEHDNDECDYAFVDIDEEFGKILAGKLVFFRAMKKSNPDLLEMTFMDEHCLVYRRKDSSEKLQKLTDDMSEWCELPDGIELPEESRYVTWYLVVCESGFYWQGYPDGCDFNVMTQTLSQDVLSQVI